MKKFQSWCASSDNHLLWISGRPGKGKSHLASFVGEKLSHRTAEASSCPFVLKFSCKNTDIRQSTSLAVHLNVLHQILQFCRSDEALHEKASSILNDIHTKLNSNLPRDDLWGIIKEFINRDVNTTDHLTYFILDGLDECDAESMEDLSEKLQHLCSTACRQGRPHFKAILLSRPLATISNRDLRIDLDDDEQYGAQILQEIRLFINDKMGSSPIFETWKDELEIFEDDTGGTIKQDIPLGIAIVAGQSQDALDRLLPVGLPSMYNRMLLEALRGKYDGKRNFDPKACAMAIQFVCVAFRPLTLTELQGAAGPSSDVPTILSRCRHMLVRKSINDEIREIEGEIKGNIENNTGEKTFQLVHLSLKQYLQQRSRFTIPAPMALLLWPSLSMAVDTLRITIHRFYYLDHILFGATILSLNGFFKHYPAVGFVLVALLVPGLSKSWKQERSWLLHFLLRMFEGSLALCVYGAFAASEPSSHKALFLRSVTFLMDKKDGLQMEKNINLFRPGALSSRKPKSVDAELAPFGQYACRFWADHLHSLREVDWTPREKNLYGDVALRFLESHLLDWLRNLSLQNRLGDGVRSIKRLIRTFETRANAFSLGSYIYTLPNRHDRVCRLILFLKDAERFVMQSVAAIERAPFQVYGGALAFCPNNSIVRSMVWDRVLPLADKIKTTQDDWSPVLQVLEGNAGEVISVAFSNDGKTMASATADGVVLLWDTEKGRFTWVLTVEDARVNLYCVAFSRHGQVISSGWRYGPEKGAVILIWDRQTGEPVKCIETGPFHSPIIACSPDSDELSIAYHEDLIQIWSLRMGNLVCEIPAGNTGSIMSMAFSPDGYLIASGIRQVKIWNLETRQLKCMIESKFLHGEEPWLSGQNPRLDSMAFQHTDSVMAPGPDHGIVQLWDPKTGGPSKTLSRLFGRGVREAFSPDRTMIASEEYSRIILRDSTTSSSRPERVVELDKTQGNVIWMTMSSNKKILATLSGNNTISLWSLQTGGLTPLGTHIREVFTFALSPHGYSMAFSPTTHKKTIALCGVVKNKEAYVLDRHSDDIVALRFSPDGLTLASFSSDCVCLWDPATGVLRRVLKPTDTNYSFPQPTASLADPLWLDFSRDSRWLAFDIGPYSNSAIQIWDLTSAGGSHLPLEDYDGYMDAISLSSDGRRIATIATQNDMVQVWDTSTGQQLHAIRGNCGLWRWCATSLGSE
ncbi:hypothetical protein CEP52_005260 [Fusarium oligoseptatum]|uniref:Nephrocystin 3-like N-terminal domain-containing protein n=1 Tax=Fusarium oligoseptatum TaxID=2604345 RepID=A0A428TZD1_9HYPO|nr:hypothetical protein CEP52_005260 [Fusarium oligoseptatum]